MFISLYLLWLILNGRLTPEICLMGIPIALAVGLLSMRMLGITLEKDLRLMRNLGLGAAYIAVLLKEIFKANLQVLKIVLNKKIPVHQTLLHMDIDLHTAVGRAILANSITLTPGTITVSVEGGHYIVHCLSREMMDGIQEGTLMKLLRRMEAPVWNR